MSEASGITKLSEDIEELSYKLSQAQAILMCLSERVEYKDVEGRLADAVENYLVEAYNTADELRKRSAEFASKLEQIKAVV